MSDNFGTIKGKVRRGDVINPGKVSRNTGGTRDYNLLMNKPLKKDGTEIMGGEPLSYEDVGAVGAENELHINEIDRMFATVFGE